MFVRDDSFRVIHHPNLNEKTLIATTFLKKGSIFWFWGSFRKGTYETPSCNDYEMQCGEIIVDPQSYKEDSLLQYCVEHCVTFIQIIKSQLIMEKNGSHHAT
jgi:hypothetical protein